MNVILAALGGGTPETITVECLSALKNAGRIIGAKRLLEGLPEGCSEDRVPAVNPEKILKAILERAEENGSCVVVYSGDTGFYSGVRTLVPLLREHGIACRVLPGISSVQLLSAKILRPWQDWLLVSAHGCECNAVAAVCQGKPAFFLTGGSGTSVKELCLQLVQAGLGFLKITVGERLSYPDEKITEGTAEDFVDQMTDSLAVMLVEPAPIPQMRCGGFSDDDFIRGAVPMTKQEVRAAVLAKLAVEPYDTVWDVGAGTGSVSVELALAARYGNTFAVECNPEACELIVKNREKFKSWNLHVIEGYAPDALELLPAPDVVFIGGTKGNMDRIIASAVCKNPKGRICVSAIALETVFQAITAFNVNGRKVQVSQISVSRSKEAGHLHLMMSNNPVFLITGECDD